MLVLQISSKQREKSFGVISFQDFASSFISVVDFVSKKIER